MAVSRWLCILGALLGALSAVGDEPQGPRYAADGALVPPLDYRDWVYLSSGLDMSYAEGTSTPDHSVFDNVFVNRAAWTKFSQTGRWPNGTMFVLEIRAASTRGAILTRGQYQTGEAMALEMHVRDEARFKGGWGFFELDGATPSKVLPTTARCYACHESHGAVDTTFSQFYPTARPVAEKAGNFRSD